MAPISLHSFLTRLIWICILPLILLAAVLAADAIYNIRSENDLEANDLARNFAVSIDQNLRFRIAALETLAASSAAAIPARRNEYYDEAMGYFKAFGAHVILTDMNLQMIFNTRAPFDSVLPALPQPASAAMQVLKTGKSAVGDTVLGPVAKQLLIAVAVPVVRQNAIVRILLATIGRDTFQRRLDAVYIPDGWILTLIDGTGQVIARTRSVAEQGPASRVNYQQFRSRLSASNWSVMLEVPRTIHVAPVIKAVVLLLLVLAIATLVSIVGGMQAGRRLEKALAVLADPFAPETSPTRITEISAVRDRLVAAAALRERSEAELQNSERRFRATFEQAAVGIALVAPDGHWLRVNQRLCRIVGYGREELLALTFQDITHPDDLGTDLGHVREMLEDRIESYAMEKRYIQKNGAQIWIRLTVSLVRDEARNPAYFISVVEDIQRRKQVESALQELNAELEKRVERRTAELGEANKELESFAYSASHDLRAPLRSIGAFSRILEEGNATRLDPEGQDALARVITAANRMGELIDDLLQLSRLSHFELEPEVVDLSELARSIAAELQKAEGGRSVAFEIPARLIVQGDRRLLRILLENLFGNAWKFTSKHAHSRIELSTTEIKGERVYYVRDDGAGFDMTRAANLFSPFIRMHTAGDFPGTGIGLSIVRRVVLRHGGRIWAESEIEHGTTFFFTLSD